MELTFNIEINKYFFKLNKLNICSIVFIFSEIRTGRYIQQVEFKNLK